MKKLIKDKTTLKNRIKKILFSYGFPLTLDSKFRIALADFMSNIVCICFDEMIIAKINNLKNNPLKENKLILDYFAFLFPEEFYIFSERYNE